MKFSRLIGETLMSAHEITLIIIGLAVISGVILQVKTDPKTGVSTKVPELLIGAYLLCQGIVTSPIMLSINNMIGDWISANILLFIPAAIITSGNQPNSMIKKPSRTLWLVIGIGICAYDLMLNLSYDGSSPYILSSYLCGAVFLGFATVFNRGFHRFILAVSTAIWTLYFLQLSPYAILALGVCTGAIVFSFALRISPDISTNIFQFDLDGLIKAISTPLIILDLSGKIIYQNNQFLRFSGYDSDSLRNADAVDLFDIPSDWRFRLFPTEAIKKVRCHLIKSDGKNMPVDLWLNELHNSKGTLCNLLCLIDDDSERELLDNKIKDETIRFTSFYETSLALSSSLEMKDVLRAISRAAEKLTNADTSVIFSLDHARQVIKPMYSTDEAYNAEVMNFEMALGQGLTGNVARDGKHRIQNYDDENKVATHIPGTTDESESLLSVPLVVKDIVIGALTLYKVGQRRFEEDDVKILTVFASQASTIIETSRLYMKLKSSEKLYRYSVDMAGDVIFFVDPETGKINNSNEMAAKLFKYSKSEFASMHIWEIQPESQMHISRGLWEDVKKIGWGKLGEIYYLAKDGAKIPTTVSVSMVFTGETTLIQWMIRDISEFKRALEKTGFFQHLIDNLAEPILITDSRGRNIYINDAFCRSFKVNREDMMIVDIQALSSGIASLQQLRGCFEKLKEDKYFNQDISIGNDNDRVIKRLSIIPHNDENGDPQMYIWLFTSLKSQSIIQKPIDMLETAN
jgi:PAS domain S-box-containing protein